MRKGHEQLSPVPGGLLGFPAISSKPGEQLSLVNNRDNMLGREVFFSWWYWMEKLGVLCPMSHTQIWLQAPRGGCDFPVLVFPEPGCSGCFCREISRRLDCTARVSLVGLKAGTGCLAQGD